MTIRSLLVGSVPAAEDDCYLINSPMLPEMKKDADGGLMLYIQNESPGKGKESNWLPAPKGPFAMYMRLYWPACATRCACSRFSQDGRIIWSGISKHPVPMAMLMRAL